MSEARLDDVIVRAPADVIYIGATFAADMKAYRSCVCMAVSCLRVAQLAVNVFAVQSAKVWSVAGQAISSLSAIQYRNRC